MAVQSTIFNIGTGLTFPSTKTIATKQHMAVWMRNEDLDIWQQLSVARYDLINNSAVIKAASDMEGFGVLELRVADDPDELGLSPTAIAIVAGNIDEIRICADNISDIISLAEDMDSVTVVYQNIDSVVVCADNITEIKAAPAAASEATQSADDAQLYMWNSQAEAMTSDSYANEPENVLVKNWTSDGDGTFTSTNVPNTYSSLHWAVQAAMSALGLNFQDTWDASTGVFPTTRPPEGTGDPLEAGDLYIISVAGNIDGIDYFIGDRLVINGALEWVRVPNVVDWGAIQSVPSNVVNALPSNPRSTALLDTLMTSQAVGLDQQVDLPDVDAQYGTLVVVLNSDVVTQLVIGRGSIGSGKLWTRSYSEALGWGVWLQYGSMTWDGTTLDITL